MHTTPNCFSPTEIREHFRGGAWDQPAWFLSPSKLLDDAGFPLDLRKTAAAELQWLYPPNVCREVLASGKGPSLSPLFWLNGWSVCPLLAVGLDIAVVGRFDDRKLIAGLRSRDDFESAATELSVWANLKRARFDFDRLLTSQAKTPDFRVCADHRLHRLEVKKLRESDYEALRRRASLAVLSAVASTGLLPRRLGVLRPTPGWLEVLDSGNLKAVEEKIPALVREARVAFQAAKASGGAPGRYCGGPHLVFDLEESERPQGAMSEELLPDETPVRRAERAVRLVRDACNQLRDGVGVVVVDVGDSVHPMRLRETLLGREEGHPVRFSSCETVIVRGIGMNQYGEPTQYALPIPLRGSLNPVHERIAKALAFRYFRNPMMGRRGSRLLV